VSAAGPAGDAVPADSPAGDGPEPGVPADAPTRYQDLVQDLGTGEPPGSPGIGAAEPASPGTESDAAPTQVHPPPDLPGGPAAETAAASGGAAASGVAGADAPTHAYQGMPAPPVEDDPDAPTPPEGFARVPWATQTAQFPPAWAPPGGQGYPGYAGQPGQPGQPGQWPPPQGPPPQQKRSGGSWKAVVAIVAALMLLAAAGGVGWVLYDRSQRTVELLAVDEPGGEPFTPNMVQGGTVVPTTPFDAAANRNPAGNTDGLYFDMNGTGSCNRTQLATSLQGDPELAAGWATPLGITAAGVADYITTLTPARLRADTRMTAHGWSGGQAEPYAAVLQAGSAVLVDDRGVPRVRCADGAPLANAQPVADPYFDAAWPGFDPNALVEVRPAVTAIPEFGLVDTAGEQPFRRLAGTTGYEDVAALPETGRFNGAYVLTGAQTRCEGLVDCAGVALLTLSPRFTGCPQKCTVSEREVGDSVSLTKDGATWRASGNVPENRAFTCQSRPTANTFTVSFTPTRSQVVNGVWTATSVRADYERRAPAEAGCVPVQVAWTINGVGG
jgi:hypothetical protein